MNYWIFKSEPSNYSIDDLQKDTVTEWNGIRNYQVRNMIRDDMQPGDKVLFYHSSCKDIGITGSATVTSAAQPDSLQFQKNSPYFDPKSTSGNPRWLSVNITFVEKFPYVVSLTEIRSQVVLQNLTLLKKGNRLSITKISASEYRLIAALAKKKNVM